MALLENPLPPRHFRDVNNDMRRSLRASSDRMQTLENGFDEEGSFRSSKIDMKQLVSGGKMSISPSGRDIVMASRDGLFIIDLDNPLNIPSFLPQGGMWEIADVQWNPHSSWSNYILSTSGEKLLVWNLGQSSKTHIEHILQSHIRAITDINWHNSTPSRLATCAIDSWVWLWDLRAGTSPTTKIKPTMGLSAFNESATQVKWNFRNEHILASSHNKQVLVWDERKGSKPINEINAHDSKIYGVNWSRFSDHEIITCSLDKTIKKWDVSKETENNEPLSVIHTDYPVWRARSLPFGRGILAQPQRGRNALEMYRFDQLDAPVHSFDGFSELVTEFVWRSRGGDKDDQNQRDFELITWDRASILRIWPVDVSIMEKVGYSQAAPRSPIRRGILTERSYRDELELQSKLDPVITAPTHQSGVLKSIKASQSHGLHRSKVDNFGPSSTSPVNYFSKQHSQSQAARVAAAATTATSIGAGSTSGQDPKQPSTTMGKGHGPAARPTVDADAWRSAVSEAHRRSSSNGSPSTRISASLSRGESRVRGRRSGSRAPDLGDESDGPLNLKEEIAQAQQRFESPKLSIVDINLNPGNRKCSIEMHGPTGLFIRILFTFRDNYPGGQAPNIDIDRNHKINPRKRAFILRELRDISAKEPLVIEPCIRFLLGLPAQGHTPKPFSLDSDSDDENVQVDEFPGMDTGAPKIQQNQPPRERTSQAVFSANGTLVRIVRTESSRPKQGISPVRKNPRSSTKPASHLGDLPLALRGLATMAKALPAVAYADHNAPESSYDFADSFSTQPGVKHTGLLGPMWNRGMPFMHRARGKASVLIEHYPSPAPDDFDPGLAAAFSYTSKSAVDFCIDNALVAALHGRGDYRRILESLAMMLQNKNIHENLWNEGEADEKSLKLRPVIKGIHRIYESLIQRRNLHMLAMFSIAMLLADSMHQSGPAEGQDLPSLGAVPHEEDSARPRYNQDYFSLRPRNEAPRAMSPTPPATASPEEVETPPAASTPPPQRSLTSKAGAFGGVLYPFFFTSTSEGSEPSRKSRGSDPPTPVANDVPGSIPVPQRGSFFRSNARSPRQHRGKSDASVPTLGSVPTVSTSGGTSSFGRLGLTGKPKKTTTTPVPTPGTAHKTTITFALIGQPKAYLTSSIPQERWRREGKQPVPSAKFYQAADLSSGKRVPMPESVRAQYITHVHVYGELLFRAGLLEARAEVLDITNCPPLDFQISEIDKDHLTIRNICSECDEPHEERLTNCPKNLILRPECTYCRLPVRGLSRTCLKCKHTTHLKCWDQHLNNIGLTKAPICASGCGCECPKNASFSAPCTVTQPSQKAASPVAYRQWAL